MGELEMCISCDGATGRAGRGDDSLYCPVCDKGPYCDACWYDHCLECYSSELSRLRAENERLQEKASRSYIQKDRDYWQKKAMDMLHGNFTQCCSYCGWEAQPPNGWEELQGHIKVCPEHPLPKVEADLAAARKTIERVREWAKEWMEEPVLEELDEIIKP